MKTSEISSLAADLVVVSQKPGKRCIVAWIAIYNAAHRMAEYCEDIKKEASEALLPLVQDSVEIEGYKVTRVGEGVTTSRSITVDAFLDACKKAGVSFKQRLSCLSVGIGKADALAKVYPDLALPFVKTSSPTAAYIKISRGK